MSHQRTQPVVILPEATPPLTVEMVLCVGLLFTLLVVLAKSRWPTDVVFLGGLLVLVLVPTYDGAAWHLGLIPPERALSGFGNPGVLTIGFFYGVVCGLRYAGAIQWLVHRLLVKPTGERSAIAAMMAPVMAMSTVMNNTPLVALWLPVVQDYCRQWKLSPSKLLIPLSYAAILGGMCTLSGTSTNMVVSGLLASHTQLGPLGMFDMTPIGLACAGVGFLYLWWMGPKVLPDRPDVQIQIRNPRKYLTEMMIPQGSPLHGQTVADAGLRHLPTMFLAGIVRSDQGTTEDGFVMATPGERLFQGDRLIFTGMVEGVRDLQHTFGLMPATDEVFKLDSPRFRRQLFEVVVSDQMPLVGKTIREGQFRSRYDGVVLAVVRRDERMHCKIGDIVLEPGDTLLIEAESGFDERYRHSRDFFLLRPLDDSTPIQTEKAGLALGIFVLIMLVVSLGWLPILTGAMVATALMLLTRCCTVQQLRESIPISLLVSIAAAIGWGEAVESTGAAKVIAHEVIAWAGQDPFWSLVAIYGVTALMSEFVANNVTVALVFPLALAVAQNLGVPIMPYVMAILIAASACFALPMGYQTHMMVYGPGGYRLQDFLKIGIPLNILVAITALWVIRFLYPL